jgi:hypothetical protein
VLSVLASKIQTWSHMASASRARRYSPESSRIVDLFRLGAGGERIIPFLPVDGVLAVGWPAIRANAVAIVALFEDPLFSIVVLSAKALQLDQEERGPIATMRHDVVDLCVPKTSSVLS